MAPRSFLWWSRHGVAPLSAAAPRRSRSSQPSSRATRRSTLLTSAAKVSRRRPTSLMRVPSARRNKQPTATTAPSVSQSGSMPAGYHYARHVACAGSVRWGLFPRRNPEDRRRLRPPEQRSRVGILTKDTKAIIGTIVATALTLGGLLVNRIGNVETEIRAVRSELGSRYRPAARRDAGELPPARRADANDRAGIRPDRPASGHARTRRDPFRRSGRIAPSGRREGQRVPAPSPGAFLHHGAGWTNGC